MVKEKQFDVDEAKQIGDTLGIDWNIYDVEDFRYGLEKELEHGVRDPTMEISRAAMIFAGKIAWSHLNDNPDYYSRF